MIFIGILFAGRGRPNAIDRGPGGICRKRAARRAPSARIPAMHTRRRRNAVPSPLVVSGLIEVAAGALAGWPYTLVRHNPEAARRLLGIRSGALIRQWHLDLAMLRGLTVAVGTAVPDAPL